MKKALDGSITCNLCNISIKNSGNTSNLRAHLQTHHSDVQLGILKDSTTNSNTNNKHKMLTSMNTENHSTNIDLVEEDECSKPKLIKLNKGTEEKYCESPKSTESKKLLPKQLKVDNVFENQKSFRDGVKASGMLNRLLFMIAKDQMPYSCVEKIGFCTLLNYAAPLYQIPSRKTITLKMEEKYDCLSNIVKDDLSKINYITLTTDAWSDTLNNISYLGMTCHFIKNFELQSINIGVRELNDHHTSDNLQKWILEIIQAWKINVESIVAVVADNAANIKKALKDAFGEEKYLSCLAHTLNLVPSAVLRSANLKPILTKVKDIVKYFKQSNNASDKLRELTIERLIQSVETRWNSDYLMLDRFYSLSDKVVSVLLQIPKSPTMCNADEMLVIKELLILLKPFADATNILSGQNYVTGSQAIPIIKILEKELEKNSTAVSTTIGLDIKSQLIEQFKSRFEFIEKKSLIAMATVLDPRFKKLYFRNKVACADAINKISQQLRNAYANPDSSSQRELEEVDETSTSTNDNDFWNYHKILLQENEAQYQKENRNKSEMPEELRYYLQKSPISKDSDPLLFWKEHSNSKFADLAIRYLTIIATSVPSERLFSTAGLILSQNRNRLTPEHFQQLLFLNLLPIKYWNL